jgi:hypothetical protein
MRTPAGLHVLPEDDANRQIANPSLDLQRIQVLPLANGWMKVLKSFELDHVQKLRSYSNRFLVLLIDFDGKHPERLDYCKSRVPDDLKPKVFVLGALGKPENLRADLGSYETIGRALALDCLESTNKTWNHKFLTHNANELDRLRESVRPILFPQL